MKVARFAFALSLIALPAAAQHTHPAPGAGAKPAPLYEGLGTLHRAITTKSPEAQRYFDQGLRLMFAFNLEEAQRSFEEAARRDPECASCWWGVALSLGPHINLPAQPDRTQAAFKAVQKARTLAPKASEVEKALVEALSHRYTDPPPSTSEAQRALDQGYADAMRQVAKRFPEDADVHTFFAESLMDLRPWDLWTADGKPQPGTEEILATLEGVLARHPDHPGANHFYIHSVEASPHPEKALAAAGRLKDAMPGAAHLVHMPSHIYQRVGRYEDAAEANRRAIKADSSYLAQNPGVGFYFMYVAHNYQFLWAAALMQGREAEALEAARSAVAQTPVEMFAQMPGLDFTLEYPVWTLVRFGRWEEVLKEPAPPVGFPYAAGAWRAARGIALAALGRLDEAAAEQGFLERAAGDLPPKATQGFNPAHNLLGIASNLLAGRMAARRGKTDEAIRHLEEAVRLEDGLRYNEPSDWYYPVRPTLGAALLDAGRPAEAQAVFEADLQRNPENGWSLAGLAESLRRQKKEAEAAEAAQRLGKAWARADRPVEISKL